MPKRQWPEGQHITPQFQKDWFGENAIEGHKHDGLDQDGSAPKIDAKNHMDNLFEQISFTVEWVETGQTANWSIYRSKALRMAMLDTGLSFSTASYGASDTITISRPGGAAWGSDWFNYGFHTVQPVGEVITQGLNVIGAIQLPVNTTDPIDCYHYPSGSSFARSGQFTGTVRPFNGVVNYVYTVPI